MRYRMDWEGVMMLAAGLVMAACIAGWVYTVFFWR